MQRSYTLNNKRKLRTSSAAAVGEAFKGVVGVVGGGLSFAANRESIRSGNRAIQENIAAAREQERNNFETAKLELDRQKTSLQLQIDLAREEARQKLQQLAMQEKSIDDQIGLLISRLTANNVPLPANLPPMPVATETKAIEPIASVEHNMELVEFPSRSSVVSPLESTEPPSQPSIEPIIAMEAAQLTAQEVSALPEAHILQDFLEQIGKLAPGVQQQLLAGLRAQNLPNYIISAVEKTIAQEPVTLVSILPPVVQEVLAPVLQPQQRGVAKKAKAKKAKVKKYGKKMKKAPKPKQSKGPKIKRPKVKTKKLFQAKARKGKKLKKQ